MPWPVRVMPGPVRIRLVAGEMARITITPTAYMIRIRLVAGEMARGTGSGTGSWSGTGLG